MGRTQAPSQRGTKSAPAKEQLATTNKKTALQKSDVSDEMLLADQGAGTEGISVADMAIPRISILQKGSPQLDKTDGLFVKGAEQGDFLENVTNSVYAKGEDGFIMIPVCYQRNNIEWILKKLGGGFVQSHGPDDAVLGRCKRNDDNQMLLPNGHEVVTTAEYYCYVLTEDGAAPQQVVISMAKTQLKKARKLNTQITSLLVPRPSGPGTFNPAMFYSHFKATTVPESNDKGSWMGWSLTREGNTLDLENGSQIYLAARHFRESVQKGQVKVSNPVDQGASTVEAGDPDEKF